MNNLEIIKAYQDAVWTNKDINAIDKFFNPDALTHSPIETTQGTEKMKENILKWHIAFPNSKVSWDDFICEGDKVVCRWHAEGLNEGEFLGHSPSNKNINYSGVTIYQLDKEKISQYWAFIDMQSIFAQLS